jgi:hypothetical protein
MRIAPKGVLLGHGADCDVTLNDKNMLGVHARISQYLFGRWIVEDMNSCNGALVNGHRVEAQSVQLGQTATIRPFEISLADDAGSETIGRRYCRRC